MAGVFKRLTQLLACAVMVASLPLSQVEAKHHVSTAHGLRAFKSTVKTIRRTRSNHLHGRHHRKAKHHIVHRLPQQVGVLMVTESGETLLDQLSDTAFNPASVAKMVTAYGAMKRFGLNHQFTTTVSTTGKLDPDSGVLNGNLYIAGHDPDFEREDAVSLKQKLLESGIKQINGKLIVSPEFSLSSVSDPGWSAHGLSRIWTRTRGSLRIRKGVAVGQVPADAVTINQYNSETFRETLKEMLSFSQNGVAEQIGRCAGGIHQLQAEVSAEVGLPPGSLQLATASGLGRNRATPKDMMVVLKAFREELRRQGLDLQDVFPVAGIDEGTLDERFTDPFERGSVVGKTGTLPGTDGGASALVGMFRTQREDIYFVIFCWRGSVIGFRQQQDHLIRQLQATRGGPKPFEYRLPPETISSSVR